MTANVLPFRQPSPPPAEPGNGAREALIEVCLSELWVDWLLAELYQRGFVVTPHVE